MSYENVYYSPEAYGLETVGEVEWSDGCYQFDTTVVWKDKTSGDLFMAEDSGCSCPSPFESHNRSTLTPVNTQDLLSHFDRRKATDFHDNDSYYEHEQSRINGEIAELKIGRAHV